MKTYQIVAQVCDIVKEAGELLVSFLDKEHSYNDKSDGSFFTEADVESENFLKSKLLDLIPGAGIIAEESGVFGGNTEYTWIIDPLDGTSNFSKKFPYFAVSVALAHKNKPIIGVTYNPVSQELFYGYTGGGAFLNGKPIKVNSQDRVDRAVCSLAVPCKKSDCGEFYEITKALQDGVSTIRKLGSASLDLASVACGRLDGAVLKYVSWWDIAAGIVLIQEAGGKITGFHNDDIGADFESCLGSNGLLHHQFQELLA